MTEAGIGSTSFCFGFHEPAVWVLVSWDVWGRLKEESALRLIQVVGRIPFLVVVVVGLRCLWNVSRASP